jgi:hypothetical protein
MRSEAVKYLKLCPLCRRRLRARCEALVGAWYCTSCERAFSDVEVRQYVGNIPGGVTSIVPRDQPMQGFIEQFLDAVERIGTIPENDDDSDI